MGIRTALVVDDSRSVRCILQRLLEQRQIRVELADSAQQAFVYLRRHRPDVVFMDDMMPGTEGGEAIERLGADPRTADIPIILYTGRDYAADVRPLPRRGVIGVLSKPFTADDVNALLAKLGEAGAPRERPLTPRLVRLPQAPASAEDTPTPTFCDTRVERRMRRTEALKAEVRLAADQVLGEALESEVEARIERHTAAWRRTLEEVRGEQARAQSQLLDERLPRVLELLEQRLEQRLERHAADVERWVRESAGTDDLGPLQCTQVAHIARTEAHAAVERVASRSARRVAAELMRGDIHALALRVERLRRRTSRVIAAAAVAVLATGVGGYLLGVLR